MKQIIRWPGLIAFVAITGLIAAFFYFFAANLIKLAIERGGEELAGAKVDVVDVELKWHPAQIRVIGLEVADAEQPMQNLFEFEQAEADIDLLKLAMGQVIISELVVDGVRIQTARTSSGALKKSPEKQTDEAEEEQKSVVETELEELGMALPETDEILAREPLLTDQRKAELDELTAAKQQQWAEIEPRLPTQEKIDGYKQRWETIRKRKIRSLEDFQRSKAELDQLKKDIKADKQAVADARSFIRTSKGELKTAVNNLKAAPKQDINNIKQKYTLDEQGLVNLSGLLFGPEVNQYTEKGLYWYKKLKPFLVEEKTEEELAAEPQRKQGRFVRFPEDNPLPDVLVKKARVTALLPQGEFLLQFTDITHQQNIINRPTRLLVTGDALQGMQSVKIDAVFDHRRSPAVDSADLLIKAVEVDDFKISGGSKLPIKLAKALADFSGRVTLTEGVLDGKLHGDFADAVFDSQASSGLAKEISLALQQVDSFTLDAGLGGTIKDLDLSLRSDLDQRMQAAFDQRVEAKKQAFEAKLNAQLQQRLTKYLGEVDIEGFDQQEASLDQTIDQLEELLKAKLDSYKDQKQKELEDKLKDKLKGLF